MTSSRETVLCQYHYDPLDRLTSHALPDIPERQRFYCKSRLATEIQGAMRYSIIKHGDQLLAQQRSEGDASDTTLLATDLQRSVLQTLKADRPPKPIGYSPYGHRPVESGLLSLLGFNGERPDPITGCYLLGNGYRAFNPVLMRFNSPDSLSPFGKGGLNAYVYCAGDPINRADPAGHAFIKNIISISRNTITPIGVNAEKALYATKRSLGGARALREQALKTGEMAEKILLDKTIDRSLSKIAKNFDNFENPQFEIATKEQVQKLFSSTKEKLKKHADILFDLKLSNINLISKKTQNNITNIFGKIDRFTHREAMRVSHSRRDRLERDGVINYTPGGPPNYDDELFPRTADSPSISNDHVRRA